MPLSINTNIASMTAQRSFLNSNSDLETAFERLATGKRVNSSVDDAAGLAIGKDLESRVRGLNQAIRNVNDGISMIQIAEGTLDEVTTILQRMRDLSVQASNDSLSLTSTERGYLETEHAKLATALDSALNQAKFNESDLIDADGTTKTIQSGADAADTTTITIDGLTAAALAIDAAQVSLKGQEIVSIDTLNGAGTDLDLTSTTLTLAINGTTYTAALSASGDVDELVTDLNTALGNVATVTKNAATNTTIDITYTAAGNQTETVTLGDGTTTVTATVKQEGATYGIAAIDAALASVASNRASLGATQSQLESAVRNLANVAENTAAAAGRIMDTDYAAETANLTRAQILQQAATSILAQANAQPQAVLTLLQG